jgi:hypothetical protein
VVQYFLLPSAATLDVVAILDAARLWPVGHDPALRTDPIAIAQAVRVGRWPVPRQGRRAEWIDARFADEEAEYMADFVVPNAIVATASQRRNAGSA